MMAQAWYKVTITNHDYHYTKYTAWVEATSKNQALIKAAALAGQEMMRRDYEQTHGRHGLAPETLLEPDVTLEKVSLDEYWDKRDTVEVQTT